MIKSEEKQQYTTVYEVQMRDDNEVGNVILKINGPNAKQIYSIGINKSKTFDTRFVRHCEIFIRRLLNDIMTGKGLNELKSGKGYSCFECKKKFITEKFLQTHMVVKHKSEEKIQCETCKKHFKTRVTLKTHMDKFHPENSVKAKKTENVENNQSKETSSMPQEDVEEKNMEDSSNVIKGNPKEDEIKVIDYNCPICKRIFPSQRGMKGHITRTHLQKVHKMVTGDGLCNLCGQQFSKEKALRWHEKMCNKRREVFSKYVVKTPFRMDKNVKVHENNCELCDKIFTATDKIGAIQKVNEHKRNEHPIDTEKYREKKNCDDCEYEADTGTLLKKHMLDNHQIWDFSRSISPPSKRMKEHIEENLRETHNSNSTEKDMNFEGLISDLEDMELDEEQKRSKLMDQKIIEKRKRNDMEE